MTANSDGELARKFEEILVRNLGEVGRFLMAQQLESMGRNAATFTFEDVDRFIKGMKEEFEKVIGWGVDSLEKELRNGLEEG